MAIWAKTKSFFVNAGKKIASVFANLVNKIKSSKLTTLVVMQLKDKWNFSFKTNKKGAIFKIITYIVIFAVITAISTVVLNLLTNTLNIFITSFIPTNAMNLIIIVLTVFEGISILVGLTNTLYFSKDSSVLITYPVNANYLFLSKMIVYFVDAVKNAFMLFIPLLIGYGILNKLPVGYFFWLFFVVIIYILFIISVCSILSVPTYFVIKFINKFKIIKFVFVLALLAGITVGAIFVIKIIPENINLIREFEKFTIGLNTFLKSLKKATPVFYWITLLLCGTAKGFRYAVFGPYTILIFFGLVIATAGLLISGWFLSKPFYNKMIATSHDHSAKKAITKPNFRRNKFVATIYYELLRIVKDEKQMISTIIFVLAAPILTLFVNKFYSAFATRTLGDILIVVFNYFFLLLLVITHNVSTSHIYSKDGPSWNINKTMPINPRRSLSSRLIYNGVISIFIIIPSTIIFASYGKLETKELIFYAISILIFSILHIFLSAGYDFMHSENKDKADIGSEIISKHETISFVFGLIIAAFAAFWAFVIRSSLVSLVFGRIALLGVLILALEVYMFLKRIKALYQEN